MRICLACRPSMQDAWAEEAPALPASQGPKDLLLPAGLAWLGSPAASSVPANPAAAELLPPARRWPGRLRARSPAPGHRQVLQMPSDMGAAPELRRRRERWGSFHVRAGVAGKRAPPSMALVYCIGVVALLANAGRTLAPKGELCLGTFWCISLTPVACKPQGVKYELHTLPVDAEAVTDGDTITVRVNMANHPESGNVPQEVHEAAIERTKARAAKNYQRADALHKIILDAGYRQVPNMRDEQVLTKKYRIRLRGINAPESLMPYGKQAKEELARLLQGKTLKISIYDSDRYGRLVRDVDCNGVSVQEHMLKKGLAWHYTAFDHRMELSEWENQARASRTGLWALPDPEKPWEWRKKKRIRTV